MAQRVGSKAVRAPALQGEVFTAEERVQWLELMTVPNMRRALYREPRSSAIDLLIPAGCPAECLLALATTMGMTERELARWLGIELGPKRSAPERLSLRDCEALLDVARLIGQLDEHVSSWCSAATFFSSGVWLKEWLRAPADFGGGKIAKWRCLCLAAGRRELHVRLSTEYVPDISIGRPARARGLLAPQASLFTSKERTAE